MATYKTIVFEELFNDRWDPVTRTISRSAVTLREIQDKIQGHNETAGRAVSDRNPANFFIDYMRRIDLANKHWPKSVFERGFTARQLTGGGLSFEFVPRLHGQSRPFSSLEPRVDIEPHVIQSYGLNSMVRNLDRHEDIWLMQIAAKLGIVETHLALYSAVKADLNDVELLQFAFKQNEIDGLFVGHLKSGAKVLVPVEAKVRDDIYPNQIQAKVEALRRVGPSDGVISILPIALKVVGKSMIHVFEFPMVSIDGAGASVGAPFAESCYTLVPEVAGV